MLQLSWLWSDPLEVGVDAPLFTAKDQDGNEVSLQKLRGKNVILVFYPGDDTTVCTKQVCEIRDNWQLVKQKNAVVFGINPQSAESHKKFVNGRQLPFPLLVDQGQKIGQLYHAHGLIVKRTVYLIGPDGKIKFGQRGKPSPAEVLRFAE
ncbi:peroxiredoxin [Bryobacter aggregatus]|uniref:peroxiredoxin n=1 Tax=Bryobacter aggregatus TaxID=360054 RepID=UPI0004E2761F|nr:peroxiredoxin [Bryobacter aggregatus]